MMSLAGSKSPYQNLHFVSAAQTPTTTQRHCCAGMGGPGKTKQALAWRANLVRLAMKENNEMMAVIDELMDVNRPARTTNG